MDPELSCDLSCQTVSLDQTVYFPGGSYTWTYTTIECKDKNKWHRDLYSPVTLDDAIQTSEVPDDGSGNPVSGKGGYETGIHRMRKYVVL